MVCYKSKLSLIIVIDSYNNNINITGKFLLRKKRFHLVSHSFG